jgi:hypothetical protein
MIHFTASRKVVLRKRRSLSRRESKRKLPRRGDSRARLKQGRLLIKQKKLTNQRKRRTPLVFNKSKLKIPLK